MSNDGLQFVSQFVKYFSLVIGTASSVWGATTELKEPGANGQKRLTKSGKVSIAITIVSFVVSLTSAGLGDRLARGTDRAAAVREARTTRDDVLMIQSLRSLKIEWVFPALDAKTSELFSDNLGKNFARDRETLLQLYDGDAASYEYQTADTIFRQKRILTPSLNLIGGAGWSEESTLALFALDDPAAVVVPMGYLKLGQLDSDKPLDPNHLPSIDVAAGVRIEDKRSYEDLNVRAVRARALTI